MWDLSIKIFPFDWKIYISFNKMKKSKSKEREKSGKKNKACLIKSSNIIWFVCLRSGWSSERYNIWCGKLAILIPALIFLQFQTISTYVCMYMYISMCVVAYFQVFPDLEFPLGDAKNFVNKLPKSRRDRDTSAFFHSTRYFSTLFFSFFLFFGRKKNYGLNVFFLWMPICHSLLRIANHIIYRRKGFNLITTQLSDCFSFLIHFNPVLVSLCVYSTHISVYRVKRRNEETLLIFHIKIYRNNTAKVHIKFYNVPQLLFLLQTTQINGYKTMLFFWLFIFLVIFPLFITYGINLLLEI